MNQTEQSDDRAFFWKETIEHALKTVSEDLAFAARLRWGLAYGSCREHWFQAELAYRLQSIAQRTYEECRVACEHKKVDIVFFERPATGIPLWENEPTFGIQLKWFGNWSVSSDQSAKFLADIKKVAALPYPAMALLVFHAVDHRTLSNHSEYVWLKNQFAAGVSNGGILEAEELQSSFQAAVQTSLVHTRRFMLVKPQESLPSVVLAASYFMTGLIARNSKSSLS